MDDHVAKLMARGIISDRAAQRMMTHQAEQPNPARPYVEGVKNFARGGLSEVLKGAGLQLPDWSNRVGDVLQSEAANTAIGMTAPLKGIKAFHASPHDFDQFDINKVGTGQGAQSYGHGLYAAESPAVSGRGGQYDQEFTAKKLGKYDLNQTEGMILNWMKQGKSDLDIMGELAKDGMSFEESHAALDRINKNKSHIYEVSINADPEHFLDWDKPLSEQHEHVRPILEDAIKNEAYNRALASTSKARADELWGMVKDPTKAPVSFAQDLLKKPETVDKLRAAGIPGIKYLDQGSRFQPQQVEHLNNQISGLEDMLAKTPKDDPRYGGIQNALAGRRNELSQMQPTRNFVVFDDKLIDIMKKYGLAGLSALPAMGAYHFQDQDIPQQ